MSLPTWRRTSSGPHRRRPAVVHRRACGQLYRHPTRDPRPLVSHHHIPSRLPTHFRINTSTPAPAPGVWLQQTYDGRMLSQHYTRPPHDTRPERTQLPPSSVSLPMSPSLPPLPPSCPLFANPMWSANRADLRTTLHPPLCFPAHCLSPGASAHNDGQ
ncbi:hypothetical protein B0H11DRAFT_800620 [Mycena galericulata]|nr:hypothetical protein B0H11DRAFT_800620 [Mycena galericulata]